MSYKISKLLIITVLTVIVSACSNTQLSHEYLMKGQVVSTTNNNVVVCIGSADGATVGQKLDAYRFVTGENSEEGANYFKKIRIGHVKISKIINKHFARVTVLDGDVQTNDMLELKK
ncbi:MAG: hypothetical protein JKX78_06385 [Alteromonadaceae bacterium]|nr:hypothetical protein [Alteromonadaceae bacterium]